MKISKFVSLVLVASVALGLVAPQQARASVIDLNCMGDAMHPCGMAAVTAGQTTFDPVNPFSVTQADGIFEGLAGNATLKQIIWTDSGAKAKLVGGAIMDAWVASLGGVSASFDLNRLTFAEATDTKITIEGMGKVTVERPKSKKPIVQTAKFETEFGIGAEGKPFTYKTIEFHITTIPDGGSALGLLTIGLVAVEGLRRKIGTRQNRYT